MSVFRRPLVGVMGSGREEHASLAEPLGRWLANERVHLLAGGGGERLSRNHIDVLSADVVVVLPGGAGTSSEVALALRYARPVVAFVSARGEIPALPPEVEAHADLAGVSVFVRAALLAAGVS